MKLTYYKGQVPNFGDELNAFMWQQLIKPGFFDENDRSLFLGIGSIIWDEYPSTSIKTVVGSGYAGYNSTPDVTDGTWDFAFVRGPYTAKALNIDPKLAITDAAILTHYIDLPKQDKKYKVSFMPHWESLERGNWQAVCAAAKIHFIDPRSDVSTILQQVQQSELLLSEAMHGVILADTLRTPWHALEPVHHIHRRKWFDWSESMELKLKFKPAPASNLLEFLVKNYRINPANAKLTLLDRCFSFTKRLFINSAAGQLNKYSHLPPQLSNGTVFISKAEQALNALRKINGIELYL